MEAMAHRMAEVIERARLLEELTRANRELETELAEGKQTREALRESEARYRDLYDEAPIAYFSVSEDGDVVQANRKAEELLGYTVDELIGRPALSLYADTPNGKDAALVAATHGLGMFLLDISSIQEAASQQK